MQTAEKPTRGNLIGITSFRAPGDQYPLEHAKDFLEPAVRERAGGDVLIIAHARFPIVDDRAEELVETFTRRFGGTRVLRLDRYRTAEDQLKAIGDAGMFYVGGGDVPMLGISMNAERNRDGTLVDDRDIAIKTPILEVIRQRIELGADFAGQSAGQMVIARKYRYHYDSPVAPDAQTQHADRKRGQGLGFIDANVSPHYEENTPLNDDYRRAIDYFQPRLRSVLQDSEATMRDVNQAFVNSLPGRRILAMENGSIFIIQGQRMMLEGRANAHVFRHNQPTQTFTPGSDLSFLLARS